MTLTTEDPQPATSQPEDFRQVVFNLPNQLTWLRLILAAVMFGMIAYEFYGVAMWMFLVAVSTDWLDGYFARKYNLVTTLGRILDPFADKVIICGTFIYLAAIPEFSGADARYFAYLWPSMAVIVIGRELLVTALRSFLEEHGRDFSATMAGKLKMVLQCVAAAAGLFYLDAISAAEPASSSSPMQADPWLHWTLLISIWSAVVITVYSGAGYVVSAVRLLRDDKPKP